MANYDEKLLIRGVNWIGDAVMSIPALRALRVGHPNAKIYHLLRPSVSPLFEKDPNVDEIIIYENRFKSVIGRINLSNILRKEGFSMAYLLQNAFDAALLAFLSGIPERIGYNRDKRGFMLTKPIPYKDDDRKLHHVYYYLNLLNQAGLKAEYSMPYIFQSIDERIEARKMVSNLKRPIIGINPGATYGSAKRWLPERFAELINCIIEGMNGSVIIFGSENEVNIANDIEALCSRMLSDIKKYLSESRLINLTGRTSLRELISLISECDVLVTNDSGPMHISYAVGTPVVSIFGSTCPELTGPPKEGNVVIRGEAPCSPCFKRKCPLGNIQCMFKITTDDVYNAIKTVLPINKAVFFDRDGTLCQDVNYLNRWENFSIAHDIDSIARLKVNKFLLIGISNQSGIARKIVNESFVQEVNRFFIEKHNFDDFFYCPHHPDENCSCRKPELAMIYKAKSKYKIDIKSSYFIGDTDTDMLFAKAAGAKGILVKTGKQKDSLYAEYVAVNLTDAVNYILNNIPQKA